MGFQPISDRANRSYRSCKEYLTHLFLESECQTMKQMPCIGQVISAHAGFILFDNPYESLAKFGRGIDGRKLIKGMPSIRIEEGPISVPIWSNCKVSRPEVLMWKVTISSMHKIENYWWQTDIHSDNGIELIGWVLVSAFE